MDNADLLSSAAALLERYRVEEHELELELMTLQARLQVMRDVVASLSGRPRGRPRKVPPRIVEQDATPESEAATQSMLVALSS